MKAEIDCASTFFVSSTSRLIRHCDALTLSSAEWALARERWIGGIGGGRHRIALRPEWPRTFWRCGHQESGFKDRRGRAAQVSGRSRRNAQLTKVPISHIMSSISWLFVWHANNTKPDTPHPSPERCCLAVRLIRPRQIGGRNLAYITVRAFAVVYSSARGGPITAVHRSAVTRLECRCQNCASVSHSGGVEPASAACSWTRCSPILQEISTRYAPMSST